MQTYLAFLAGTGAVVLTNVRGESFSLELDACMLLNREVLMIPGNFDRLYPVLSDDVITRVSNEATRYYPGVYMMATKVLFCVYGAIDADGRLLTTYVPHAVALFGRDAHAIGRPVFESVCRALAWMVSLEVRTVPQLLHHFVKEVATHRGADVRQNELARLNHMMRDYHAMMHR